MGQSACEPPTRVRAALAHAEPTHARFGSTLFYSFGSHRIARMALDVPSDPGCGTRVNPEKAAANIGESRYEERKWERR